MKYNVVIRYYDYDELCSKVEFIRNVDYDENLNNLFNSIHWNGKQFNSEFIDYKGFKIKTSWVNSVGCYKQ